MQEIRDESKFRACGERNEQHNCKSCRSSGTPLARGRNPKPPPLQAVNWHSPIQSHPARPPGLRLARKRPKLNFSNQLHHHPKVCPASKCPQQIPPPQWHRKTIPTPRLPAPSTTKPAKPGSHKPKHRTPRRPLLPLPTRPSKKPPAATPRRWTNPPLRTPHQARRASWPSSARCRPSRARSPPRPPRARSHTASASPRTTRRRRARTGRRATGSTRPSRCSSTP